MSVSARLAGRLRRIVSGPMWHGPAFDELLADVSPADAAARPIAGAHTIWELVLHSATWAEISFARLRGKQLESPPAEADWPPQPAQPSDGEWAAARQRLADAYGALADAVKGMSVAGLDEMVRGQEHSVGIMMQGVVEHGAYHAGQIALLKRALDHRSTSAAPRT